MKTIKGNIVDIIERRVYKGEVLIEDGIITKIIEKDVDENNYIIPGLIDAHVHIESSLLIPSKFAEMAVRCGTVATVSDPHEIANVMGKEGVHFMIENGKKVPLKFFFGAPSCVPATDFETSGAEIDADDIERLIDDGDVYYLSEMMNFPGVVYDDFDVSKKLEVARKHKIPIDGHAPGLSGEELEKYINAGITTDHECTNIEEAEEKINKGMKILIREGSAAKNLEALFSLVDKYPDKVMICTDDSHPDDLQKGHINKILSQLITKGVDKFNALRAATINTKLHYNIPVGALQVGDIADITIVNSLSEFDVLKTIIEGKTVYDGSAVCFKTSKEEPINNFNRKEIRVDDIAVVAETDTMQVIDIVDGELFTRNMITKPEKLGSFAVSDSENDILKIVVLNRYDTKSTPAIGFIHNFGIKTGAVCSSIAHDSHNLIAVGIEDYNIVRAINSTINMKGGISVCCGEEILKLQLEFGGIMTQKNGFDVAKLYERLDTKLKELGSELTSPLMTLAFMALLVIPELKLGDKGLFNGKEFKNTPLFV